MGNASKNIRFLFWKQQIDRRDWTAHLAVLAKCERGRAENLLRGEEPGAKELALIAASLRISATELKGIDLLAASQVDILFENLRVLINGLGSGKKSVFANSLGLHPTTISGWLSGKARPEKPNLGAICKYFRLPSGTNLEEEPLFLSILPVSEKSRKRWLRERIEILDASELQELFPVIERILRER
ncbi:MAG TPA: hypothetical protein VGK27_06790 [Candidatus Deferrimicrobiaceae bacterium]